MKILEYQIDGIYMFKYNKFKFYTDRIQKNPYRDAGNLPIKDINIIVGGNASGKTTLSKALLLSNRIVAGFQLKPFELESCSKKFGFKMKYLQTIDNKRYIFEYEIKADEEEIYEKLSYVELGEKENLKATFIKDKIKMRKIDTLEKVQEEKYSLDLKTNGFQSKIMNSSSYIVSIAKNIGYTFSHIEFGKNYTFSPNLKIKQELLERFLCIIDKSIKKVEYTQEDKNDFYIYFRNDNDPLLIDHSQIQNAGVRLSYGTVEAIIFFFKIHEILNGRYNIVYIDEELSHLHSDLEKLLITVLIECLPKDSQLFVTTHNLEMLKINLPVSCYMIVYEDEFGYTKNIHVEDFLENKNDRNAIYNKLKNDYFKTEKNYDEIYDIFMEFTDED